MTTRKSTVHQQASEILTERGFDEEDSPELDEPTVTELGPTTDLEYLKSQRKALDDQIKSIKSTTPGQTKLQRLVEKQHAYRGAYVWETVATQTIQRMEAGQSQAEAFEAVVKMHVDRAQAEIERRLVASEDVEN